MPIYWQLSRQRVNDVCRPKVVCPQLLKRGKSTELGRASTNCVCFAVVRGDRKGKRVEKWAAHCHFLWHQRARPFVPNPHTKALLGSNFQCDEEPRLRGGVGFRGLPARADLSSAYCEKNSTEISVKENMNFELWSWTERESRAIKMEESCIYSICYLKGGCSCFVRSLILIYRIKNTKKNNKDSFILSKEVVSSNGCAKAQTFRNPWNISACPENVHVSLVDLKGVEIVFPSQQFDLERGLHNFTSWSYWIL